MSRTTTEVLAQVNTIIYRIYTGHISQRLNHSHSNSAAYISNPTVGRRYIYSRVDQLKVQLCSRMVLVYGQYHCLPCTRYTSQRKLRVVKKFIIPPKDGPRVWAAPTSSTEWPRLVPCITTLGKFPENAHRMNYTVDPWFNKLRPCPHGQGLLCSLCSL